jgi:hypothetical protein
VIAQIAGILLIGFFCVPVSAEIGEIRVEAGPPAQAPGITDRSALWLRAGTRVTVMLKDGQGRRTGVDASRKIFQQIPHSRCEVDFIENRYTGEQNYEASQRIGIEPVASGVYTVWVRGLQPGPYEVNISALATNGSSQPSKQLEGLISEGETKLFTLTFDPGAHTRLSVVEGAGGKAQ